MHSKPSYDRRSWTTPLPVPFWPALTTSKNGLHLIKQVDGCIRFSWYPPDERHSHFSYASKISLISASVPSGAVMMNSL
jgi:hypothetical protein